MFPRVLPGLVACLFAGFLSAACAQGADRPLLVKPPQMQETPAQGTAVQGVPVPPAVSVPVRAAPTVPMRPAPVKPVVLPARRASGVVPLPASGVRPAVTGGRVLPAAPVKLRLMPAWTGQFLVRPREVAPFNPLGLPATASLW